MKTDTNSQTPPAIFNISKILKYRILWSVIFISSSLTFLYTFPYFPWILLWFYFFGNCLGWTNAEMIWIYWEFISCLWEFIGLFTLKYVLLYIFLGYGSHNLGLYVKRWKCDLEFWVIIGFLSNISITFIKLVNVTSEIINVRNFIFYLSFFIW